MELTGLTIKNFRMLEDFTVKRLGRLNLIAGRNNSGKSSVLEAIRIFAGNANHSLLTDIAVEHDEPTLPNEEGAVDESIPFEAFFTGRRYFKENNSAIQIGDLNNPSYSLTITPVYLVKTEKTTSDGKRAIEDRRISWELIENPKLSITKDPICRAIRVSKDNTATFDLFYNEEKIKVVNATFEGLKPLPCSYIPTTPISMDALAKDWEDITLTEYEKNLEKAMKIIEEDFEAISFITSKLKREDDKYDISKLFSGIFSDRKRPIVRMAGVKTPLPLRSMGDGMLRVLQLALKVPSATNGFLLIDEFDNGLHHTIQEEVWDWLFKVSSQLNIQVFATTHSQDCIKSFSKVALKNKEIGSNFFRVGRSARTSDGGKVTADEFEAEELPGIIANGIELR